jgi:NADH-quinone oxidoreductase subunit E
VLLAEAVGGKPDDLKLIRGVGPKLESTLNDMGFFHFDQIAAWTPAQVDWVDRTLEGVNRGRATRDDWVSQAKLLATGELTEFAKRVEAGEVPTSQ